MTGNYFFCSSNSLILRSIYTEEMSFYWDHKYWKDFLRGGTNLKNDKTTIF